MLIKGFKCSTRGKVVPAVIWTNLTGVLWNHPCARSPAARERIWSFIHTEDCVLHWPVFAFYKLIFHKDNWFRISHSWLGWHYSPICWFCLGFYQLIWTNVSFLVSLHICNFDVCNYLGFIKMIFICFTVSFFNGWFNCSFCLTWFALTCAWEKTYWISLLGALVYFYFENS